MKYLMYLILSVLFLNNVKAQQAHYRFNPSLAGSDLSWRVAVYHQFGPGNEAPMLSNGFSFDGLEKISEYTHLLFGAQFNTQVIEQNIWRRQELELTGGVMIGLKDELSLRFGLSYAHSFFTFDTEKLIFGSQLDLYSNQLSPSGESFEDLLDLKNKSSFHAGFSLVGRDFFAGVSGRHISRLFRSQDNALGLASSQNMLLPTSFSVHGGYIISNFRSTKDNPTAYYRRTDQRKEELAFVPSVNFTTIYRDEIQAFSVDLRAMLVFSWKTFHIGKNQSAHKSKAELYAPFSVFGEFHFASAKSEYRTSMGFRDINTATVGFNIPFGGNVEKPKNMFFSIAYDISLSSVFPNTLTVSFKANFDPPRAGKLEKYMWPVCL